MQFIRAKDALVHIKTKLATITLNDNIAVNDKVLPGPGEYEVADVFAEITPDLAHFHAEELTVAYLGHKKRAIKDDELGQLENIDILLVAVDAESPDELAAISKLTAAIEPRVIVLVGVTDPAAFAKIRGTIPEVVETLKISLKELPETESRAYILQ